MPGLNSIMDSSLSALFAAQAGMATTGHNIANANTPGFSRQDVIYAARRPDILPYGAIGRGVEIQGIRRIQDDFLVNNLRSQSSRLASFSAVDTTFYEVEHILGSVENDHLGNALNNFFSSWNDLAQPPITAALKEAVRVSGQALVADFQTINNSLNDLEENIENSIQAEITNLNGLLTQVSAMNEQIMAAETNGEAANDLRDQRDYLITQVSEIAQVSVLEREDGTKDIILAGRTMVSRGSVTLFQSDYQETADGYKMGIVTQGNLKTVNLSTGKLEGLMASRDIHLKSVRTKLDQVAKKLIEDVNSLHTQGRTATSSGLEFFTGDSIHTIAINQAITSDSSLIATGVTDVPGDTELAQAIANLTNVSSDAGSFTVNDEYRSLLTEVASNRNTFEFMVENQQNVVAALNAKMASVSGVSLDEEGANLVRYQNSYNAAARVIATVQSMYDALMNMV